MRAHFDMWNKVSCLYTTVTFDVQPIYRGKLKIISVQDYFESLYLHEICTLTGT